MLEVKLTHLGFSQTADDIHPAWIATKLVGITSELLSTYDDVMTWKHFLCDGHFVLEIRPCILRTKAINTELAGIFIV